MLVIKALPQDVAFLAFIPLSLSPGASGQQDVGHKGVVTRCDAFSLCSFSHLESRRFRYNQLACHFLGELSKNHTSHKPIFV